jgi:uncharacterized protein YjbI with pentapeptide repeats
MEHSVARSAASPDAPKTAENPITIVIRDAMIRAKAQNKRPAYSHVVQLAQQKRYRPEGRITPEDVCNLRGISFRSLLTEIGLEHFVFDGEGLDQLRQWAKNATIAIDLRGACLDGCVITPESGFPGISVSNRIQPYEGIMLDTTTQVKGLMFEGFHLPSVMRFDHMNLELSEFHGINQRGPVQSGMKFEHTDATGIDMTGAKLANLTVVNSTLNYALLQDVSVIMIDANKSQMQGVEFSRASFGPDSRIIHTDCTCANFSGAALDNLDLSNSTLCGVNFTGVDITKVNFSGAEIDPQSLIGAIGPNGPIQTIEQAQSFMISRGMKAAGHLVQNRITNAQSNRQRYEGLRQKRHEKGFKDISRKRNMDAALHEAYKELYSGNIAWNAAAAPTVATNQTVNRYKVDHSDQYSRSRPTNNQ